MRGDFTDKEADARSRRHRLRASLAVSLIGVATMTVIPSSATAVNRPMIKSFYARDDGAYIQLRVNWCVNAGDIGDSIISTFRMWDESTGRLIFRKRVSGTATSRCMTDSTTYPEGSLYAGVYSANATVTDRTRHGFVRIAARTFNVY